MCLRVANAPMAVPQAGAGDVLMKWQQKQKQADKLANTQKLPGAAAMRPDEGEVHNANNTEGDTQLNKLCQAGAAVVAGVAGIAEAARQAGRCTDHF